MSTSGSPTSLTGFAATLALWASIHIACGPVAPSETPSSSTAAAASPAPASSAATSLATAPVASSTAPPLTNSGESPAPADAAWTAAHALPKPGTPGYDPCQDSPPVPHPFTGLLRAARCDQEMYLKMAFEVADPLGVQCSHCHVRLAADPKKLDFPVMTPKKEIANWMNVHLMKALKEVDGSPMQCKSCHVDAQGKPIAKILGHPRDPAKAQEWMSMVLVNKFVTAKGEKLKCKSCHVGNYSSPQWKAKVILQTAQIPPH